MKIIRCQDITGKIVYAAQTDAGPALKIVGDIFSSPRITDEPVEVAKLLAPVSPTSIICIGLNYRKHAEETHAKIPEYPVVFFKGINTLLHPDQPILLPTHLKSDEVDY